MATTSYKRHHDEEEITSKRVSKEKTAGSTLQLQPLSMENFDKYEKDVISDFVDYEKNIGSQRQLKLKHFMESDDVSITEYVPLHGNGTIMVPSARYIDLSSNVLKMIAQYAPDIDNAIRRFIRMEKIKPQSTTAFFHMNLGDMVYITIAQPYRVVNFRVHYVSGDYVLPTKRGLCLKFQEWRHFKDALVDVMTKVFPTTTEPCKELHQNLEEALSCAKCIPEEGKNIII